MNNFSFYNYLKKEGKKSFHDSVKGTDIFELFGYVKLDNGWEYVEMESIFTVKKFGTLEEKKKIIEKAPNEQMFLTKKEKYNFLKNNKKALLKKRKKESENKKLKRKKRELRKRGYSMLRITNKKLKEHLFYYLDTRDRRLFSSSGVKSIYLPNKKHLSDSALAINSKEYLCESLKKLLNVTELDSKTKQEIDNNFGDNFE